VIRRAAALALAAVAAVAGCGGGSSDGGGAPPDPDLVALAQRCGLPPPQAGTPPANLFPPGLLPRDAVVFRWRGEGLGVRARVVFRTSMLRAQQAVDANAKVLGFPVIFRETELTDAELDVHVRDEVIRFAFQPSRDCLERVSEAAVRKLAGPA
jgi:hypothetical protein